MNSNLQNIIAECSADPMKFQKYMRDPVISLQLKKLIDAGLLAIAK